MEDERDIEKCNFWNFRSSVTLTLTLDQVKVISACKIHIGLPAYPTMRL